MATNQDEVRRGVFPALAWVDPRTFSIRLHADASPPTESSAQGFPYLLGPAAVLVGAAAALLVIMFERIPALAEFYLTISWSVLGVALFAFALTFKEKMYRYAGLAVLLLASLRVLFVDTRELEAFPKVGAWGVLGAVLIALGYGYVRAFARTQDRDDPLSLEPESDTNTTSDD